MTEFLQFLQMAQQAMTSYSMDVVMPMSTRAAQM